MAMAQAQGAAGAKLAEQRVSLAEQAFAEFARVEAVPRVVRDGVTSATLEVRLRRNALVRRFEVLVKAGRATATPVNEVAEVRTSEPAGGIGPTRSVVLDFGAPQTVAGVAAPEGVGVTGVTPWIGMAFAPAPVPPHPIERGRGAQQVAMFRSEIRAERLLVEISPAVAVDRLAAEMAVLLPELPSDLEIRIDDGAPIWRQPGPAQALEQTVDLAPHLAALMGDPSDASEKTLTIRLASRVPGRLGLERRPATEEVRLLHRAPFDGDGRKQLAFATEGRIDVPLTLAPPPAAAARRIERLELTVTANLPPARVVPPVGPAPAPGPSDAASLADLVLDANRAAAVRIAPGSGLAELESVRLPLAAAAGGAEARVVLWRDAAGSPIAAIPDAASEPVSIGGAQGGEVWVSFAFKRPITLDDGDPPWVALIVSRGELSWALGTRGSEGLHDAQVVRCGPPTGPWKPLPTAFLTSPTGLGALRGRLRVRGRVSDELPLDPLRITLVEAPGQTALVTPSQRGVRAVLDIAPPVQAADATLRVVSLVEGTIMLSEVDIVASA
jgi:hypothetical protein